jgi:Immunity protein 10
MPSPDFDTAALVTVEENADAFTVGLAQYAGGSGAYLILQCALGPPTDQDTATGMDTYCLMDDLGGVHYGGVRSAELFDSTLRLRFDESAAMELNIQDAERELVLAVPPADESRLADGLRRVLTYNGPGHRQPDLSGI